MMASVKTMGLCFSFVLLCIVILCNIGPHADPLPAEPPLSCVDSWKRGIRTDAPRHYSLTAINRSASVVHRWWQEKFDSVKAKARGMCMATDGTTSTGGWCYPHIDKKKRKSLKTCGMNAHNGAREPECCVKLPDGVTYLLPARHVASDAQLVATVHQAITHKDAQGNIVRRLSVNDFGAGVGQLGYALSVLDPLTRYKGYDGAGNVEAWTRNAVSWFDLSIPLSLPRAHWVVSTEVGEHLPPHMEASYFRNLHAHNCHGVILGWAALGQEGDYHINCHSKDYVIDTMQRLGYFVHTPLTMLLQGPAKITHRSPEAPTWAPRWGWIQRNAIAFKRHFPLTSCDHGESPAKRTEHSRRQKSHNETWQDPFSLKQVGSQC